MHYINMGQFLMKLVIGPGGTNQNNYLPIDLLLKAESVSG